MDKYPWITFKLDISKRPWKSWMDLGECVSKCAQLKQIPLTDQIRRRLHMIYLSKGVQATVAIEGNTLSEEEVRDIIENKRPMPESKRYLEQEVRNIAQACKGISSQISEGESRRIEIDIDQICKFNLAVLEGLPLEDNIIPGELRRRSIVVGNVYRGPAPQDVPYLLREFCTWINGPDFHDDQFGPVALSIIRAIMAHLYIAWIHPFGDGNGRTARLLEFAILLSSGIPSPAAHLLSNHYNTTRNEYYRQLDVARKSGGDVTELFRYAIEGLRDGLDEQLEHVFGQVIDVSWRDYIHEWFRKSKGSIPRKRQRDLALLLSEHTEPLTYDQILLGMAASYKGKTEKTLTRDLRSLEKEGLIKRVAGEYAPQRELILKYLPLVAEN